MSLKKEQGEAEFDARRKAHYNMAAALKRFVISYLLGGLLGHPIQPAIQQEALSSLLVH